MIKHLHSICEYNKLNVPAKGSGDKTNYRLINYQYFVDN